MKKFFAFFAAMLIVASTAFAVSPNALDNSGPWDPDASNTPSNFPLMHDNDYSFDFAVGEYKIFVICELTIQNVCGNIYLGWLNPDGSRVLGDEFAMTFKVQGGNGWKFESNADFGYSNSSTDAVAYSQNEQTGNFDNNVFITGSNWYYNGVKIGDGGNEFVDYENNLSGDMYYFGSQGFAPGAYYGGAEYDILQTKGLIKDNATIKEAWVIYDDNNPCENCLPGSNACQGTGTFTLVPGTVWAAPDATEGFYTFPVYINVDYLTFDNQDKIKDGTVPDYSSYKFDADITTP